MLAQCLQCMVGMSKPTIEQIKRADTITYEFSSSSAAWDFMRACDAAGLAPGFPELKVHTVKVALCTYLDRERADELAGAGQGSCVNYEFARKS
jgi:hypothetical protein